MLADLAEWKQWRSRLPQREGSCYFKWKNGGCQRARCWPLLVECAQRWFQIIWFNLFLGIKLALQIAHFAVASRRPHSHIKLKNCSFGRLWDACIMQISVHLIVTAVAWRSHGIVFWYGRSLFLRYIRRKMKLESRLIILGGSGSEYGCNLPNR